MVFQRIMNLSRMIKYIRPATITLKQLHCHSHLLSKEPSKSQRSKQVASNCRQNYHEECENEINKQINHELQAGYVYLSIASHFDRQDVALKGFHEYFKKQSDEEFLHADQLIKFQNERGGRLVFQDLKRPAKEDWGTGLEAMEVALDLEKNINQTLLDLHKTADKHGDVHLQDFLEANYLIEQVQTIKEMSDHIANLKRNGPGMGEYLYDKHTLQNLQK